MSRPQRRAMIDRDHQRLSLVRQCALLGISRSSLNTRPRRSVLMTQPEMGLLVAAYW